MKVKFLNSVSTALTSFGVGSEHDLGDALAAQWIKAGYCVAVEDATPSAPEVAPIVEPVATPAAEPRRTRRTRKGEELL